MEIFMKENGMKIRLMDMELIHILMVLNMKVIGLMISKKDKEENIGLMARNILVSIKVEKNVELGNFYGQMDQYMKGNFMIII
jgi:hypothetical protein